MRVATPTKSVKEVHDEENARAKAAEVKAAIDYNILMGILEDPNEEEEEEING